MSTINKWLTAFVGAFFLTLISNIDNVVAKDPRFTCPTSPKCDYIEGYGESRFLAVLCVGINGTDELLENVEPFHGKSASEFGIHDSTFPNFPKSVFSKIEIREMSISNCNFTRFGEGPSRDSSGLEFKVKELSISVCNFEESFDWAELRNLKTLTSLSFDMTYEKFGYKSMNRFNSTMVNFRRISSLDLERLEISGTSLTSLEEGAVSGLHKLEHLGLMDNLLSDVWRTDLPKPALRLRTIILRRNRIHHIPHDFFDQMPVLKTVDFEGNLLKTLDQFVLVPVFPKLLMIALSENPINCDPNILWITQSNILGVKFPESNDFESLLCYTPLKLRNKTLLSITEVEVEMENDFK